jgi:glucose/arabinose dehydrogenase
MHVTSTKRVGTKRNGLVALFAAALATPALAQSWQKDFVTEDLGAGWDRPTCLCFANEHSAADLLVSEKAGVVSNVRNGVRQATPVIDLRGEILDNGDRGLLAVRTDPEWSTNGWIYLLYVVDPNGDGNDAEQESFGRLTRYTTYIDVNGDIVADPASRLVLIGPTWPEGIPSLHLSHSTGDIQFGLDGSLFISTGDGAHYDLTDDGGHDKNGFGAGKFDPSEDIGAYRSQLVSSLAGKILRLDPATGLGLPDNPFWTGNGADNASRVWAMGLRNPFKFIVRENSPSPGRLFVSDVGWNDWEEINSAADPGDNFGWPCWEGPYVQSSYDNADRWGFCNNASAFKKPLWTFNHSNPAWSGFVAQCVTGEETYKGTEYPSKYVGRTFFCEYSSNFIRTVRFVNGQPTDVELFGSNIGNPIELTSDPENGDLIYIAIGQNAVRRIRYTKANHPPVITATATPTYGAAPLAVTFDASGTMDPDGDLLSYAWTFGDGGTDTNAVVTHTYTTGINYTASLTVTDARGEKSTWSTLISVDNTPPVITALNSPVDGSFYTAGQLLTFDATASDTEDAAAGLSLTAEWTIDLIHDHHEHPGWIHLPDLHNTWTADSHGPGTYYFVTITVTDSRGLTASQSVRLYDQDAVPEPHLVSLEPASLRLGASTTATAHLHYAGKGTAKLVFRWGDGTSDRFDAIHMEDHVATHTYSGPGLYTLRVAGDDGVSRENYAQTIFVRPLQPSVALFTPLVAEHCMTAAEQWQVASEVANAVRAAGFEAQLFGPSDQAALASWLDAYLDDGIRDYLVCLDSGPSAVYAGQNDGSRAETWLDKGNGVLWTGYNPFGRYILDDGTDANKGSGKWALDEVLDAATQQLCSGIGAMQLDPAAVDLPSLAPFSAERALVTSKLNSNWAVDTVYASDGATPPTSDALVLRDVNGGEYAQFYCVNDPSLPRAEVLSQFFLSHLFRNLQKGPGKFRLVDPPDQTSGLPATGITFDWKVRSGATSWLFELARDPEFRRPVHVEVVTQPTLVVTDVLDQPAQYFWRVTARNDYGFWTTDPFSFSVGTPTH